jgi:hypothetical protein
MTQTPLVFFHRTSGQKAERILANGFRDGRGTYMTDREFEGVWLSDRPLDANEGACGDALLRVTLSRRDVAEYEWRDEGKTYREWLMPAALVNQFAIVELVDESEGPPPPLSTDPAGSVRQ